MGTSKPMGMSRSDGDEQADGVEQAHGDEQAGRGRAGLTQTGVLSLPRVGCRGGPQSLPRILYVEAAGRSQSSSRNQEVVTLLLSSPSSFNYCRAATLE